MKNLLIKSLGFSAVFLALFAFAGAVSAAELTLTYEVFAGDTEIFLRVNPDVSDTVYNYQVDLNNDGDLLDVDPLLTGASELTTYGPGNATIDLGVGTHTIRIVGDFPALYQNCSDPDHPQKITRVDDWSQAEFGEINNMFCSAVNLTDVPATLPDLSFLEATNRGMVNVFYGATSFNDDISGWGPDIQHVNSLQNTFRETAAFNQPLNTWDITAVTDMNGTFRDAPAFNQDLSSWDTAGVATMPNIFRGATAFNGDITTWDVSSATNMGNMLRDAAAFNQNIADWKPLVATTIANAFNNTALSTTNYDAILTGWAGETLTGGPNIGFGTVEYYNSGADWTTLDGMVGTISDGGLSAKCPLATPTVDPIADDSLSNPIISGTYDNTSPVDDPVVISFNGTTYTSGVDAEIVAAGGTWTFTSPDIITAADSPLSYAVSNDPLEVAASYTSTYSPTPAAVVSTAIADESSPLTGTFDSTGTTLLKVSIDGGTVYYTANGFGSPLTSVGDNWSLDLTGLGLLEGSTNPVRIDEDGVLANAGSFTFGTVVVASSSSSSQSRGKSRKRITNWANIKPFPSWIREGVNPDPNPSCTPMFAGTAGFGSTGTEVTKIQSFLNGFMGNILALDGKYGPKTSYAVKGFQGKYYDQIVSKWTRTDIPDGQWGIVTRSVANFLMGCPEGTVTVPDTGAAYDVANEYPWLR